MRPVHSNPTIGIIQNTPVSNEPAESLKQIHDTLRILIQKGADIILLPELWATGPISPRNHYNEEETGQVTTALQKMCHESGCYIISGMPEIQDGHTFNSSVITGPEGIVASYRKIHLFTPFGEDKVFQPGDHICTAELDLEAGKLLTGMAICFDIRFPEIFRYYARHGAEVIFLSCLWPEERLDDLRTLIRARALENQCFIVCANACGRVNRHTFAGHSMVVDPFGKVMTEAGNSPTSLLLKIDTALARKSRERFCSCFSGFLFEPAAHQKIVTLNQLKEISGRRKDTGQKMAFTNGCFDILHAGHVTYLRKAREQGDFLVVGLNSDTSISSIKGPDRPVNNEDDRALVLASLGFVDYVVKFSDDTPIKLINELRPDILIKGADWEEDQIVGAKEVKSWGGKVIRIPVVQDKSTTQIIQQIRDI